MKKMFIKSLFFSLFLLGSFALQAQTFTVSNTATSGAGSLSQAIADMNLYTGGVVNIEFDASLAGQTIPVPTVLDITYASGDIFFNVTNIDITLEGSTTNQILQIDDKIVNLTIQKTKFINANDGAIYVRTVLAPITLNIDDCKFEKNNSASGSGAALRILSQAVSANSIYLNIKNSVFSENKVGIKGGAILLEATGTDFIKTSIKGCEFWSNEAGEKGGALALEGLNNSLTIRNTLFGSNKTTLTGAGYGGGAVHAWNDDSGASSITFATCTFQNNTSAQDGGAVYVGGSFGFSTYFLDSRAYQNEASASGGFVYYGTGSLNLLRCAIYKNKANIGGGVYGNAMLNILNTSLIENKALSGAGGGLFAASSTSIHNATIVGNTAVSSGGGVYFTGLLGIYNSLLGANTAASFPQIDKVGGSLSENKNWIEGSDAVIATFSNSTTNLAANVAKVRALTDENGFIYTYKPHYDSPLIDAGDDASADLTNPDQLGKKRDVDNIALGQKVDIGAVEVPFTVVVTNTIGAVSANSLAWAVQEVNTNIEASTTEPSEILFDILPYTTVHLIKPTTVLSLSKPTIINGFSQYGSSTNTLATGYDGNLKIVVSAATVTPIFRFDATDCVAKGLILNASMGGATALAVNKPKTQIKGCIIGLNDSGTAASATTLSVGIDLFPDADYTQIGGGKPQERNIISNCGSAAIGIQLGSENNKIQNNYIGTNTTGDSNIGNGIGIGIFGNNNLIGGDNDSLRNVISGSVDRGIGIYGGVNNRIEGNYIGTNKDGITAIPNSIGIYIGNANNNTIGGSLSTQKNLISGSSSIAILLEASGGTGSNNKIMGNYIGSNRDGSSAIPNQKSIEIRSAAASSLFDTEVSSNLIVKSAENGIRVIRQPSGTLNGLQITDNLIGTNSTYTDLGNTQNGIFFQSVDGATVTGNTIAYNQQNGINLVSGSGNNFTKNSFFNNTFLGIDLGNDGATVNDAGDADTGANSLINYPEILSITKVAGTTSTWAISYQVPTEAAIPALDAHFYISDGNGQGKIFLLEDNSVITNSFKTVNFTNANLNYGNKIVAQSYYSSATTSSEFSTEYLLFNPCPIKPTISNIKIDQKVTCTISEAKATISLVAISSAGTTSPTGTYEIDFQGDGVYDLGGLTLTNNELVFNVPNGTVLRNPTVRNLQLPSCPSDSFPFAQTINLSPIQSPTIQSVTINEPNDCSSSNGSVAITLGGNVSSLGYDVDLESDNHYEFISVRLNSANQLIINNLAGGTRIGAVQIRQSFSSDCRAVSQNQNRTLRFVSVSQSSNPLIVKVENSQLDFETETAVELSNTEIGLSYALAFNTVFSTATPYYLTNFETATAQTLTLKTGKLYENSSFKVVVKNSSGCEETVPNSTFAIQVADGIFASQIDILKLIYDRSGGANWKRKWIFEKPKSFVGVKFSKGNVLEIDLSDQNLKDTISAYPFKLLPKLQLLNVETNLLTFSSLEDFEPHNFAFKYTKQEKIGKELHFTTVETATLKLEIETGGKALNYQWFRNKQAIEGATKATLTLEKIKLSEAGIYFCVVKSDLAPDLSLQTENMFVSVLPLPTPQDLSQLRIFFEKLNGKNWVKKWNFDDPNLANWIGLRINQNNKIVEINLAGNNLSGEMPTEAFTGTNNIFADLTYCNLSDNQISKIPDELALLSKLTYLDLSKNQFKGTVPQTIFKFSNLQTLFLEHNQFDEMPSEIGNLSKLRMLFLGNNLFKNLPNDMAKLTNLEALYVNNNLLKSLDWNIGAHQKMRLLSLSNNQLSQLPAQITSLKNLEEFAVASNFLSEMPNGFSNLSNLIFLNIGDNYLDFGDLEKLLKTNSGGRLESLSRFYYTPQAHFGAAQNLVLPQGNTLNLLAQTEGTANTYQWFRNGIEIKNNVSPLPNSLQINNIAKTEGGIYTVAVRNPIAPELTLYGREFNVTVTCALQTPITISLRGAANICEGETNDKLLIINSLTSETVQWFRDNARLVGQTNANLSTTEAGIYKALISDQTGCSNFTNEIEIKRFARPQVQIEADFALLKVRDASQYASFQWFKNSIVIPNATGAEWQAVELGTYQVRIINKNGCLGLSNTYTITPTATEDLDNQEFIRLYPNPVETELHIFVPSRQVQTFEMSLWNAQGQKIQNLDKQGFTNLTEKLDLRNLPSGLYFLKLKIGEEIFLKKVIVGK